MKPLGLFFMMVALTTLCVAGIDEYYSFNATTGTYSQITGTSITSILSDDALSEAIDIGFTFPYGDFVFTQVVVSSNGWVGLGTTLDNSNLSNDLESQTWRPLLAALWDDTSLSGGNAEYLLSGTTPNRIFTVQYSNLHWNYNSDSQHNFQIRLYETGKVDFVYGPSTGGPNSPSASIGINMAPGGSGWFFSVTPGATATASITAENDQITEFPASGTIYEFLPSVPMPNDLAAIGLSGNVTPSVGTPTNYTVTVRNRGTSPQSTYQVKLVTSTGTELASVNGTTLQPGQIQDFTLSWTPSAQGPLILRGKAVLAGDGNPNNDQSPPLNVIVMPAGMIVMTIGSGNEEARMPVDMFWRNSLFETLFYPAEISIVGNISALSFYNDFETNLPNMPTKIWLGTTTAADLSGGWIPSTQLTQVFDGTVNYPSGQNMVVIPLQAVFTYTGGNLVLMVNRPMDTTYYSSLDNFYCQTLGTSRTRNVYSDGTLFDPANPPADAQVSGQFPKTSIHLTPLGTDPLTIISPDNINFGQVLMNSVHSRQVTILNGGGGTVTVNSVNLSGSQYFTISNPPNLPANLVTGQNIQFNVVYAPTAPGDHTATLTITDNLGRTIHNVPIAGSSLDPTIYTLPMAQNFDSVTPPALPLGWIPAIQSTSTFAYIRTVTGNPFSAPNCVQMTNADDPNSTLLLIAPPYAANIQTNATRIHFRGRSDSTAGTTVTIGVMTNNQDTATFSEVQTVELNTQWTEYVVSLAAYTGTGRYAAFKMGTGGWYQSVYLDDVMLEYIPANDIAAIHLSGNTTPSVGNATVYTASVFNWGTNAQSNYTVKLYDANNTELASSPGLPVNPGGTVLVQLTWTPTAQGPLQIHATTLLTGDENALNDASPPLNITVMPAGMLVVTIGAGNEQALIPLNMFYRNSLYETIFYPQEIGVFGQISAISFYNNFQTNLPGKPTRIWLGMTQQPDLGADWIPSNLLTLVFDGVVDYPNGANTVTIPLQTPFTYAGGNLVMMVNRPMDTTYFSSADVFYCQTEGQNRARNVWSDWEDFQPAAPPAGENQTGQYPKTSLHMTPLGPDPVFLVSPASRNFGTVLLNTTHDQVFTVMNAGGGSLTVNTIGIAGSEHFSLLNLPNLPASLNTGQFITFTGRYLPTAAGTHTATITINDNLRLDFGERPAQARTPHTVNLSGTCVDPTITSLPYLQTFDAVTEPDLPVQWSYIIAGSTAPEIQTTASDFFTPPNSVHMANYESTGADIILIAPPYANTIATNLTRVKFYVRANWTDYSLIVGVMADPQNAATFAPIQTITPTTEWVEYVVNFSTYLGTGRNIAFKHGLGESYRDFYIDNVMLEFTPQNDLAALSVQGNTTPSVGMATNYQVNIFNWGTNAQTNYLVKLFKQGDVEIGSVAGPPVNPDQTVQATLSWTPTVEGATFIYGKVLLTGDQNGLNDQSPNLGVTVQPQGVMVLTVGDGSSEGRIPVDMYWRNSLFECLYYPAELSNTIGSIYGVAFYNDFLTDLPNMPTNVWLGTTTATDLIGGWIPSTQLTQVFSGTVNYPSGQNLVHIAFPVPFLYLTGQNLVLMVQRPMDTTYYSWQDNFYAQIGGESRALNIYADDTPFDPASPPGNAELSGIFPKTSFYIIPGGVGHLTGTVYGVNNQPLAGVAIQSNIGGYAATTDAQGHYLIQNIIADDYQFTFSIHGYITQTQNVTIPEDQTVTLNVNLLQMPQVSVSGTVVASDTGAGLNGAGIHLQGYDDYNASTNAAGAFSIPGVYANFEYSYTIICPGYQNVSGTINVGSVNYNFGTIVLNEVAYAPRQVHGEVVENNTQVTLNWLPPDPSALDVVESFETDVFPPQGWTQVITNTGGPNSSGVYPTWCRFGAITVSGQPANPPDGNWQSGLWWSYEHQDEWLVTPSFNCPPSAYINFQSYVFLGSASGDHYYVKLSVDDGANWIILWDASAQTGGWNFYASPISIDLTDYEGLQLKVAFHADDPPTNDGMWYVWFIDDIYIGNAMTGVNFSAGDLTRLRNGAPVARPAISEVPLRLSKAESSAERITQLPAPLFSEPSASRVNTRALVGYRVWRLVAGQESNESAWASLTPQNITDVFLNDSGWASLPNGTYRYAVKAVYTANVLSVPSFSNPLLKEVVTGYISGVVRTNQNVPIQGATVTAGTYSATSNTSGAFSIVLPVGTYDVTASKDGYISQTVEDVVVTENQTTTVNFHLTPGSAAEDQILPVTVTELLGNFPNPFNPETEIAYNLKNACHVSLEIYNLKGQFVRILVACDQPAGRYRATWDGRDSRGGKAASGVYCCRLRAGNYESVKKMLLLE